MRTDTLFWIKTVEWVLIITLIIRYFNLFRLYSFRNICHIEILAYTFIYGSIKLLIYLELLVEYNFNLAHAFVPVSIIFLSEKSRHHWLLRIFVILIISSVILYLNLSFLFVGIYYLCIYLMLQKAKKLASGSSSNLKISQFYLIFIFMICINQFIYVLSRIPVNWSIASYMNLYLAITYFSYFTFLIYLHFEFSRLHII